MTEQDKNSQGRAGREENSRDTLPRDLIKGRNWPYHDIVNLPHHISRNRPQMDLQKRAAQFAPFAALTGYGAAIAETARLTDEMVSLDEEELMELDRRLCEAMEKKQVVTITWFVPDEKKEGGAYTETTGVIRKVEMSEPGEIFMSDGTRIPIESVVAVD